MMSKSPISYSRNSSPEGPLVSMVTPFYNSADYLSECIDSVMGQTYKNWEYIIADNCSTDGGGAIAEKYAATDPRIRFIKETEFVGQVENYNRALGYISPESKYCKIVQADDLIYPTCIEEMVHVAESGDRVGLVSSFTLYGDSVCHGGLSLGSGPVYTGRDAARAQLFGCTLFGSPTVVMYSSGAVRMRKPFFSTTTPYFEDTETCFEILKSYDFGFVPQILTYNRRDNESIWAGLTSYNPMILYEYMFILRFGSHFLSPEEFRERSRDIEHRYYDFLAWGALHRFKKEFWQFHDRGLANAGRSISRCRVALHAASMIVEFLFSPRRVFGAIRKLTRPANPC